MKESLEELAKVDYGCTISFSPGPHRARVTYKDGLAAKLLLWMVEMMPDHATTGDVEDVLVNALYWHIHFLTMYKAQTMEVEG